MADSSQRLKAKVRIGSSKTRNNYRFDEKAFHNSDVPEAARAARVTVKQSKQPQILSTSKPSWNTSVQHQSPLCDRRQNTLRLHDRRQFAYNYRAEVLPEVPKLEIEVDKAQFRFSKPPFDRTKRTEELPVHPKLANQQPWDGTTSVSQKEFDQGYLKARTESRRKARMVGTAVLSTTKYKSPTQRYNESLRELRAQRSSRAQEQA